MKLLMVKTEWKKLLNREALSTTVVEAAALSCTVVDRRSTRHERWRIVGIAQFYQREVCVTPSTDFSWTDTASC